MYLWISYLRGGIEMQSNKDGQKVMSWYSHRSHCVEDELTFWKNLSSGKKTDHYYLGEFCKNLRIYEIDKHIKPFQQLERMSMLDLGSGPASVLSNYATDKISVIPVDVLAHEYMQISVAENLIRPIAVAGEKLSEFFPDEYFHVVFTSYDSSLACCPKLFSYTEGRWSFLYPVVR